MGNKQSMCPANPNQIARTSISDCLNLVQYKFGFTDAQIFYSWEQLHDC